MSNGGSRWPQANVGSPTGGLRLVLDIDNHDGKNGSATLDELCDRYHFRLPETFTVMTGGGGYQMHMQTPAGVWVPSSEGKLGVGLDIRADGGFAVMPPSLHKSGRRYEITCDAPLAPVPEALLTLLVPQRRMRQQPDGNQRIYQWERHKFLCHKACSLRGKGCNEAQILEELIKANARCVPPESLKELEYQAHWVAMMYPAGHGGKGKAYAMRNLHQFGIMRTLKPSVQALLYFLERKCGDGSSVLSKKLVLFLL